MMPPKGKRKSKAETYRDAMAMARLVDVDCMIVEDAAKQLGLTRSTGYRLLSRARSLLLTPEIEVNKKAAEPKVKQWYEPNPVRIKQGFTPSRPDPVAEVMQHSAEAKLPEVTLPELPPVEPVRPPVFKPPPDTSEEGRRREWRRQQNEKQMEENGHQLTFRGRQKSPWEQEDNLEY